MAWMSAGMVGGRLTTGKCSHPRSVLKLERSPLQVRHAATKIFLFEQNVEAALETRLSVRPYASSIDRGQEG